MDRFKTILRKAVGERSRKVILKSGQLTELFSADMASSTISEFGETDERWLQTIFNFLFQKDLDQINRGLPTKGVLNIPNLGKVSLIGHRKNPDYINLYIPPDSESLFTSDWTKIEQTKMGSLDAPNAGLREFGAIPIDFSAPSSDVPPAPLNHPAPSAPAQSESESESESELPTLSADQQRDISQPQNVEFPGAGLNAHEPGSLPGISAKNSPYPDAPVPTAYHRLEIPDPSAIDLNPEARMTHQSNVTNKKKDKDEFVPNPILTDFSSAPSSLQIFDPAQTYHPNASPDLDEGGPVNLDGVNTQPVPNSPDPSVGMGAENHQIMSPPAFPSNLPEPTIQFPASPTPPTVPSTSMEVFPDLASSIPGNVSQSDLNSERRLDQSAQHDFKNPYNSLATDNQLSIPAQGTQEIEGGMEFPSVNSPISYKPDRADPDSTINSANGDNSIKIHFRNTSGGEVSQGQNSIDPVLVEMVEKKASDVHLLSGQPVIYRIDGMICRMESKSLTHDDLESFLDPIFPIENREEFAKTSDTDFAYEISGTGRFRVNIFRNNQGVAAVLRHIPAEVLTAEQLGVPDILLRLCTLNKGLILVTGPTGSGKSTTLAAMIDHINKNRSEHLLTIEDPIEFVHSQHRCLVNQREVGKHTQSFSKALKAALREDPDIILIGELRDLETVHIAIETAETGHLVFGTLHTTTAVSTIDRIIDQFPADQQEQIRMMLSSSLRAVISQTLLKKKGGGRVAAHEILIINDAVGNMIRENKPQLISSHMQTQKGEGNMLLNDSLLKHVLSGDVEFSEAYLKAVDKKSLLELARRKGISTDDDSTEADHSHGNSKNNNRKPTAKQKLSPKLKMRSR